MIVGGGLTAVVGAWRFINMGIRPIGAVVGGTGGARPAVSANVRSRCMVWARVRAGLAMGFGSIDEGSIDEAVRELARAGSSFDVASPGEIDLCLQAGVDPSRLPELTADLARVEADFAERGDLVHAGRL